jgi:hypothetical protein
MTEDKILTVKRYDFVRDKTGEIQDSARLYEHTDGEYVFFSDYQNLSKLSEEMAEDLVGFDDYYYDTPAGRSVCRRCGGKGMGTTNVEHEAGCIRGKAEKFLSDLKGK